MKKLIVASVAIATLVLAGCSTNPTADDKQKAQQDKILQEGTRQTGMPNIANFTERKELKAILEKRDQSNLITYMYTKNEMSGKWVFEGEAIGYPIPYSTEYTNPSYIASHMDSGYAVLPYADPNGLFSSQSTQADWIMRVDPKTGDVEPAFCEPNIYVTATKIPAYLCESWSIPAKY